MPFPEFRFPTSSQLSSITHPDSNTPVGASVAEPLEDHFLYHDHLLKWISETKHKLPAATPRIRREAFLSDPLLKGTIYPYLKNILLQGFKINTEDNKLYSAAISEITDYLDSLDIMQVFREDFLNFMILDGHSYRRIDPDKAGNIAHLEKLEPSSIVTYTDPWISSIVAYHQHSAVTTGWSKSGTTEQVDSWFIPFSEWNLNIYDTYIDKRGIGNNLKVFDLFETYKTRYNISDISNLRIGSSERIIAMHNSERLLTQNYYDDHDYKQTVNPAPIDSVLLAIWLKRLLLTNAPNLIFVILSPFLHLKMGIMKESKDFAGNPVILSSLPQRPVSGSVNYAAELQKYTDYITATKEAMKNLMECLKNGGVFATGPDQDIKPVESSRSISFQMIQGLINLLDEEIGLNFGFPLSLVKATGTELASSRNILQNFNTVHAGERTEYERVANRLITQMFTGKSWQGKTEDGQNISYSFEDIRARFELETPDTKDLKSEAETLKLKSETLSNIKAIGASQSDVQALGEEYGFGLLGLDNYEAPMSPDESGTSGGGAQQITAILKGCLFEAMQEQGSISAVSPTEPSGFKEKEVVKKLQEAYKEAQNTINELFEED